MPPLTPNSLPEEEDVGGHEEEEEDDKEPVVAVADAVHEPQAVVVEPPAAGLTQLAVLRSLGDHDLGRTRSRLYKTAHL